MNYTASITLTGVDNLTSVLQKATAAMEAFTKSAGGMQGLASTFESLKNVGSGIGTLAADIGILSSKIDAMTKQRQAVDNLTTSLNTMATTAARSTSVVQSQVSNLWQNIERAKAEAERSSGRSPLPGGGNPIPNYMRERMAQGLYVGAEGRSSGQTSPLPGWSKKATEEATHNVHAFTDAIGHAMRGLSLFYVRARNIYELLVGGLGLRAAAHEAVQFHSALETSRLSMAASLMTFKEYHENNKSVASVSRQYTLATKEASEAQTQLRARVFDTTSTFSELVVAYQKVLAAAGKTKASSKDISDLTVNMSNMATAWGMDLNTVSTQFQSVLLGVSRVSSRVGGFLRGLGVNAETIRSWREQGIAVQELNKLLQDFGKIGQDLQRTWKGVMSNMEDAFQNVFGEGFRSTILSVSAAVATLTAQLIDIDKTRSTGTIQINQGALGSIKAMSDSMAEMVATVTKFIPIITQVSLVIGHAFVGSAEYVGRFLKVMALVPLSIEKIVSAFGGVSSETETFVSRVYGAFGSLSISLAGSVVAISLVNKAVDQMTLKAAAMATTATAARAGIAGLSASATTATIALNTAGASMLRFGASATASLAAMAPLLVAAGLLVQLGQQLGVAFLEWRASSREAERATRSNTEAIDAMRASAKKSYDVNISNGQAQELVNMGHERARMVLDKLKSQYGTNVVSFKEFQKATLDVKATTADMTDETKKQMQETAKLGYELEALKDTTGATAIRQETMNKVMEKHNYLIEHGISQGPVYERTQKEIGLLYAIQAQKLANLNEKKKEHIKLSTDFAVSAMRAGAVVNSVSADGDINPNNTTSFEQRRSYIAQLRKLSHSSVLEEIEDAKQSAIAHAESIAAKATEDIKYKEQSAYVAQINIELSKAVAAAEDEATQKIAKYHSTLRARQKRDLQEMYNDAVTATDGIAVAFERMYQSIQTDGQITANMMTEQFNVVWRTIDDTLFNIATGRFDDLKKGFSSLVDGFVGSWTKGITEVVKRWLAGTDKMGNRKYTTGNVMPDGTVQILPQQTIGTTTNRYLQGAASGYATGAGVGSASGAPGFSTGATVGGTLGGIVGATALSGSALGPWGAIIGAVIGGIVGILSAPNTEAHSYVTGGDWQNGQGVYSPGPNGGFVRDPNTTAWDTIRQSSSSMIGGLSDAFKASGSAGAWKEFVESLNHVIGNYIRNIDFEIHAGSDEDMKKNFEFLLMSVIPKEMMSQLFGVGRLETPNNIAGISGAGNYDVSAGMNSNAPLYKLFASLGFSADRIKEIASQINSTDPAVFLERVKGLLSVVGGLNSLVSDFSSGPVNEARRRTTENPAAAMQKNAVAIAQLFDEIKLFSGDEQISRAKTATEAARQFWEQQISAIQELQSIAYEFSRSIGAQLVGMSDARLGKSDEWLMADNRRRITQIMGDGRLRPSMLDDPTDTGIPGLLGEAQNNPARFLELAKEAQGLIQAVFDTLKNQLEQLLSIGEDIARVAGDFAKGFVQPVKGVTGYQGRVNDFGAKVVDASRLSGQAQIDAIAGVRDAAVDLYNEQQAMLETIAANVVDLNNSINQQIRDLQDEFSQTAEGRALEDKINNYNRIIYSGGTLNASQQKDFDEAKNQYGNVMREESAARARARIDEAQGRLAGAQTPEEVRRITEEIQGYVRDYMGSFREDDPRRRQASQEAEAELEATRQAALARYEEMEEQIAEANEQVRRYLIIAGNMIAGTATGIQAEMLKLEQALGRLGTLVGINLNSQIDQLVLKNGELLTAITNSITGFTQLATVVGQAGQPTGSGNPNNPKDPLNPTGVVMTLDGLVVSGNNARTSIDNVTASGNKLADVFDKLILLAGETPPARQTTQAQTQATTMAVVSYLRENPSALNSRTR